MSIILKKLIKFIKIEIFSTNHKDNETLYLSFAFVAVLLGLMLSLGLGIELTTPLNGIFEGNFQLYNSIVTAHALIKDENEKNSKMPKLKSYCYDNLNQTKIFNLENEVKGIKEVHNFLNLFCTKLSKLKKIEFNDFDLNCKKTIFYNFLNKDFSSYDYDEFNNLLYNTYINDYFSLIYLRDNKLYYNISFYLNLVYSKYNYPFFNESFGLFDIKSFFFKNLRFVVTEQGFFDLDLFFKNLEKTFKFFSSEITHNQYVEFFEDLFEALENNNIIIFSDNENENIFGFQNESDYDLTILINRSFQPIHLGFNQFTLNNENKFHLNFSDFAEIAKQYENFNFSVKTRTDDFVFFLILSSYTNNISYQKFLNNLFIEDLTKNEAK